LNQCFFLLATPTLNLSLGRYRIFGPPEMLVEQEGNRPSMRGVAIVCTSLVLGHTLFQGIVGDPDIVGALGTTQDVQSGAA